MKVIFKKQDLSIVPRWTDNIKDEWIKPFIVQSCELYFYDTVSSTLYDSIANEVEDILTGANGLEWENKNYVAGAKVLFEEEYYKTLVHIHTNDGAPNVNPNWVKNELLTFWYKFVRPYLVYACYKSFLLWHGKHISQGGFRKHVDNTSFEISTEELSFLLGDLKLIIGTKQTKMMNVLHQVNYTFDSIVYATNENVNTVNQGTIIFAV